MSEQKAAVVTASLKQMQAIKAIADAIVEAVRAGGPTGAPGGVIYAALMAHGISLEQYEQIMEALVRVGRLRRSGQLYFINGANR